MKQERVKRVKVIVDENVVVVVRSGATFLYLSFNLPATNLL